MRKFAFAAACCLGTTLAFAANVDEVEPNNTKATATPAVLACGDTITGTTTGTSTSTAGLGSADYYRVKTAAATPGIYRYRLTLTSPTTGHTSTIRGLSESSGVISTSSDAEVQLNVTTPDRFVQWYGFGAQEEIYYRVTGSTSTTGAYTATLGCQTETPVAGPTLGAGSIRITTLNQGHTNDTDLWVYDSSFNAIAGYGNDDDRTGADTSRSDLVRTFSPGTYYVALSLYNLANNQPSNMVDEDYKNGNVLDFPNAIADSSTSASQNISMAFIDGAGTHAVPVTRNGAFDIVFVQFTVEELPGACCFNDGSCEELDSIDCANSAGNFIGGGSVCSPNPCPQPLACCLPNGNCVFTIASVCSAQGGAAGAIGSVCDPNPCPQVPGACCFGDGSCTFVLAADCLTAGGAPQGGLVPCLQATTYSAAPNLSIPDSPAAAVTTSINVPDSFTIAHMSVALQIRHTYIGDLDILLTHGATTVQLWSGDCSTNENINIILDDDGAPLVCAQPTTGISNLAHTPGATLSSFNGLDAAGTWTISLEDQAGGDTGNLLFWALSISDGTPQCVATPAERACCFSNGSCQLLLSDACVTAGGTPGANGSNCNAPDPCSATCKHGDANCDGSVNNFDIDPFVAGILFTGETVAPSAYNGSQDCWDIRACWGDVNRDTAFNNFDIDAFVACILTNPAPNTECPTP